MQAVARQERSIFRNYYFPAWPYVLRQNNIALYAVFINNQTNEGRAGRIVFNGIHPGRNIFFIKIKINLADKPFGSSALVPRGNSPAIIAPDRTETPRYQGFFRKCPRQKFPVVYSCHLSP